MKKSRFVLIVFLLFPVFASAQEKALKQTGFWDNWYVQPQIGGRYTISSGEFGKLITPMGGVALGKDFCPAIGTRVSLFGAGNKDWGTFEHDYYKWNSLEAYFDVLFNFQNIFGHYREDRMFNLKGIMGLGYAHGFRNEPIADFKTNNAVGRIGLLFDFALNKAWSLNLEGTVNATTDAFDSKISVGEKTAKYDAWVNVMLGVSYRFKHHGNRGFQLVDVADADLIKSLNQKINEQQAIIDAHRPCPEATPCPEAEPVKKELALDAVVMFGLGKSAVAANQQVTVFNIAKFMKENPDTKIEITGYADADTGTSTINQRLSEQRAKAVADELIHKYGIDSGRIAFSGKGSAVQPYHENAWNRVVIMLAK